jgi:hypothetical protein
MITQIAIVRLHCDHQAEPDDSQVHRELCFESASYGGSSDFGTAWDCARRAGWLVRVVAPGSDELRCYCPKHAEAHRAG